LRAIGSSSRAEHLVHAYGSRWGSVWSLSTGDHSLAAPLVSGLPYTGAELAYAVDAELALTITDLLVRRTKVAFETRDHGRSAAPIAARIAGARLGWDDAARSAAIAASEKDAARLFSID
jgi:glycerol-3-phosphate dehydrogenase